MQLLTMSSDIHYYVLERFFYPCELFTYWKGMQNTFSSSKVEVHNGGLHE